MGLRFNSPLAECAYVQIEGQAMQLTPRTRSHIKSMAAGFSEDMVMLRETRLPLKR